MSVTNLSNQTVSIANPSGTRTRTGQANFSAASNAQVRFERTYKTIKTEEREREPIHAVMGVPPDVSISVGAKVTYGSEVFRAMTIAEAIGPGGAVHHREVNLQLWSFA